MSLNRKGAFDADPNLARRVAVKRSVARFVLFMERLLPQLLLPAGTLGLFFAFAWFGLFRTLPEIPRWIVVGLFLFAFLSSLLPLGRMRWPSADEGDHLLENRNNLPHQPVTVQKDEPAFDTPFARALWKEHQLRMAKRIAALDAGLPQPDIARHDRYALRAIPVVLFVIAFSYSYSNGGGSLKDAFAPTPEPSRTGPSLRIDAWVTPPGYTGRAPVLLAGRDPQGDKPVSIPQYSEVTVRISGGEGGEKVAFTPANGGTAHPLAQQEIAPPKAEQAPAATAQASASAPRSFVMKATESGSLQVEGQQWTLTVIPDKAPEIAFDKPPRRNPNGALEIAFNGKDDYGIQKAYALIEPAEPQAADAKPLYPLPDFKLDLPRQNAREFKGLTSRNLNEHPLAGKRVRITLVAQDGANQEGRSPPVEIILPARRFNEPLAAAVAEERQVFALDTRQMPKSIALNEALAVRPDETIPNLQHFLLIRSALERMKLARTEEQFKETAAYLWEIALGIDEGNLTQAEKRLRDAQQALSKALENGATDQEIAKLMKELREAMQNYMAELAQRMQNAPMTQQSMQAQNILRQQDLQKMMDQIENLARSGDRSAAQQMLSQLQQMMNSLQAGRPQRGQQGQQQQNGKMRQQIDKLGQIMQDQQKLLDETFKLDQALRDRMQRGDPDQWPEDQRPTQPPTGPNGQQQQGQNGQQGQNQQPSTDQMTQQQLRDALKQLKERQEALGKQLQELQKGLKELGMQPSPGFGEAEREMGNAGKALDKGRGDQALEGQGNALNALRQGAQNMMNQMMQAMRQGQGQPGEGQPGQQGQGYGPGNGRDPLGRQLQEGNNTGDGIEQNGPKVPEIIDAQRAREILETIREKLGRQFLGDGGDATPNLMERDYLERLLNLK
ncbi:TIGR02302 family protein [Rhizobium oryzicola]|uniref:TIGR02302 family protein n=1 Tax=Rhizobium oryzicola TaxID=1232668 RepID=A0ABT8T054_9HYPH|nr:TIGR02302 family protein [Rhizobium oryzicola]MDO1584109.1 TIGR02302 family protein [Rhizobium oryzicola]